MFNRTSQFDKLLEKATSNLLLEPDWGTIISICDLIRQGDCPPKLALNSVKKKLQNPNPHTAKFALLVLESMVKNCGHLVQDEVATVEFMEELREIAKHAKTDVSPKILELLHIWASVFRSSPNHSIFQETVDKMKREGFKFPAVKESDAMFLADTAPEWVKGNTCHRCRATFSLVFRRHHCRACGNVFCNQCTSKTCILPQFGIEKEVRVCDACYDRHNKPRSASPNVKRDVGSLPAEYVTSSLAQQTQVPKPKITDEELKEEEEMQLALALSQSEAEAREKEKKRVTSELMSNTSSKSKAPVVTNNDDEDEDPELARYLNRSYWEKKQAEEKAMPNEKKILSPDHFRISPGGPPSAPTTPTHQLENGEVSEAKLNEFVSFLKSQVEIFVNRMKSNFSRGRSISNDTSVQTLFMNVTKNHSTLLNYIHQQDDSRVYYEGLQDKLTQVKDAMMALDALREEHREKLMREAEEAERIRQLQMAQKLEIMRRRKQEYLQFQRQLAIQKMQEQEREMQMRQEQQKQQYLMGNMSLPQHVPWDSTMSQMQAPPGQYGQQYQSLPAGYIPPTGYPISGPMNVPPVPTQPGSLPMPGNVPLGMMPPQVIPGKLPMQHQDQPPRAQGLPQQQPQPRMMAPQQSQGQLRNSNQLPPMHQQIPPNSYQGMTLPGSNQMLPQSRSLVMAPPGAPMTAGPSSLRGNISMPPGGVPPNTATLPLQVVVTKGTPQSVIAIPIPGQGVPGQGVPGQVVPGQVVPGQGVPGQGVPGQVVPGQGVPGLPLGVVVPQQSMPLPQGTQPRLPQGMAMPPANLGIIQGNNGPVNGQPSMILPTSGPQGVPSMPQVQPPQPQMQQPQQSQQATQEQNESKTGELISFD